MPIEARGRKDPELARALRAGKPLADRPEIGYYVGARALKFGKETLQPGDEFPEAKHFPRLESWLRTGRIVEGPPNTIEPQPFKAAHPIEPRFHSGFPEQQEAQAS